MADYAENKAGGAWDKIKGKTNEVVGKATGDRSQEIKGKLQEGKGEVKDTVADLQGKAHREADES